MAAGELASGALAIAIPMAGISLACTVGSGISMRKNPDLQSALSKVLSFLPDTVRQFELSRVDPRRLVARYTVSGRERELELEMGTLEPTAIDGAPYTASFASHMQPSAPALRRPDTPATTLSGQPSQKGVQFQQEVDVIPERPERAPLEARTPSDIQLTTLEKIELQKFLYVLLLYLIVEKANTF